MIWGTSCELYRRNGAREYVVWRVFERRIDWFVSRDEWLRASASRQPTESCGARCFPVSGSIRPHSCGAMSMRCSPSSSKVWPRPSTVNS